jgi:hypothetical protein
MNQADKKYFGDPQSGRLNADDSPFAITTNEWTNAENVRTGSSDRGFTGIVESVGGNSLIPSQSPIVSDSDMITIGSVEDIENNRIVYFNYDNNQNRRLDQIICVYPELNGGTQYLVLNSDQVTDGTALRIPNTLVNTISNQIKTEQFINLDMAFSSSNLIFIPAYKLIDTIFAGDTIQISGTSLNNGTYTVSSIIYSPSGTSIYTNEVVVSETIFGTANIYSKNAINFSTNSIFSNIAIGYQIIISGGSSIDGTYTVSNISSNLTNQGFYNISVSSILPAVISSPVNATIKVYSPSPVFQGGFLNFSKNSLIHSARIAGSILSWVDGKNNEPRKINIERGITANYPNDDLPFENIDPYELPLLFSEITLIKRPPIFTPNAIKSYDSTFSDNLIYNLGFEFSFQYEYYDGEISVPSSFSVNSNLNEPSSKENSVIVSMSLSETIPSTVKIIYLLVRQSDGKPTIGNYVHVVKKWDKNNELELSQINNHNAGTNQLTYFFYNNFSGETLAEDDALRAFDNVPIYSQTHEVSKGRYFLGNNTVGYNTPSYTSLNASISTYIRTDQILTPVNPIGYKWGNFETGLFGEIVGPHWSVCGTFVEIRFGNRQQGWYLVNGTDRGTEDANSSPQDYPPPAGLTMGDLTFITSSNNYWDLAHYLENKFFGRIRGSADGPDTGNIWPDSGNGTDKYRWPTINFLDDSLYNYNVISQLSRYKLGVVFYDYAMRKCGVCVNTNAISQVRNVSLTNYIPSEPPLNGFEIPYNPDFILNRNQKITITQSSTGFVYGTYTVWSASKVVGSPTYRIQIVENSFNGTIPNGTLVTITSNKEIIEINTPFRDFIYSTAPNQIIWTLNNNSPEFEIPKWAYYYSVVKTLDLRTRFFVESLAIYPQYVLKDSRGATQFQNNYVTSIISIKLDLSALTGSGLGYNYTEGDQCVLTLSDNTTYHLPIIGSSDGNVYLSPLNIGVLGQNVKIVYQLYTPYTEQINEPYYEMGQICRVLNPGKNNRSYQVTSGFFRPDAWIIKRNWAGIPYYAGAMSPNDTFYNKWETDAGKVNVVTTLGITEKSTNIAWSDTYILGTKITGSSTFRYGNEIYVPDECGGITKLQLTSKVKDSGQGNVMLGLCSAETVSMYLGETQITDSTGKTQFFGANASQVISTINTLKGNYGCLNPESVSQYRGHVYFLDVSNGRVVQYSDNGLDSISLYKMSIFWKNWCKAYVSLGTAAIEALGDRPYIFTVVDPNHDELLLSLPKLSNTIPIQFGTPYPFNILDYKGKTISFKLGTGAVLTPHWQSAFTFNTENFVTLQNKLYSFKSGKIWVHNQYYQNSFYGFNYESKIMFTSNILPQIPKVYNNFVSESNIVPNYVYFYNNNWSDYLNTTYIQESNLIDDDFVNKEGVWYATILRDINTLGVAHGLLQGDVMRNKNMYVMVTFNPYATPLELKLLQIGTSISRGHTV